MSIGSVSRWIVQLKLGDDDAAEELWKRYHRRLVDLARKKLLHSGRRASDEEDLVQRAFNSFFQGVERLRFPQLDDRNDLWRLLAMITSRKAFDQLRHEYSQRQGGGRVRGESALFSADGAPAGSAGLAGRGAAPDFAVQMAEECRELVTLLPNKSLQQVALLKMEGYTTAEISQLMGLSSRTIMRKLEAIRSIWEKRLEQ